MSGRTTSRRRCDGYAQDNLGQLDRLKFKLSEFAADQRTTGRPMVFPIMRAGLIAAQLVSIAPARRVAVFIRRPVPYGGWNAPQPPICFR